MVKYFVVKNTLKIKQRFNAKSLIELIVVMLILLILFMVFWSDNNQGHHRKKNILSLKKLQYLLYLARSEAIQHKSKVYLCPSEDKATCSNSWANCIMIFTYKDGQLTILHYIPKLFTNKQLNFRFFGNQTQQKIVFLPNGLTVNNGHFCTNNGQSCLYINKAGKTYFIFDNDNK